MDINELETYNLADAVKFHNRLNPVLWGRDEHLLPPVRDTLLKIADDFREFLGVDDLKIQDITISGSNAAYSYTDHSDIDLHLVVDMPDDPVYRELFDAKKYQYNDEHNIRIGPYDVELYVQDAAEPHVSQGIYSIRDGKWLSVPKRRRAAVNDISVQSKYEDLGRRAESAIESGNLKRIRTVIDTIKNIRRAGLAQHGEFGAENLAYKLLRNQGLIEKLYAAKTAAEDQDLSLLERKKKKKSKSKKRWTWGGYWYPGYAFFGSESGESGGGDGGGGESIREAALSSPDGVSPSTRMFLSEDDTESILKQFIKDTVKRLGIKRMPRVFFHKKDTWSRKRHSFGMYDPERHELHVSLPNRHLLDILRTTAHELAHCRQHEIEPLPADAGRTGSPFEDEAHAVAGEIMRDFADSHPEMFSQELREDIMGMIPAGTRRAIAGMCAAAGLSGCVTMDDLRTVQTLGRTVQSMERYGTAGAQEEVTQEIKNYLRARQGDANAQNQSHIYRWERKQQADPPAATGTRPLPGRIISREPQQEDYDPDNPPGPESKPTMPAGTARVDVSDMYDWYKLGQHISNLQGLGQHDFGKGPPSTIVAFGSEEAEHKYIKDLEKTGLKTTDLDPAGHKKMKGQKTDPTYNVNEDDADAAPKAIVLTNLPRYFKGSDSLAGLVPERKNAVYALHPDKWQSTFYSLTNKDPKKLKYYRPKEIDIPPGTLVGDMAIANQFYRATDDEEKQKYAKLYAQSLKPYPVDLSGYRMPELLITKQTVNEATGYVPVNKKEAQDPRFVMAITKDVRPGEVGRQAKKMGFRTTAGGVPPLLIKGLRNALDEFKRTGTLTEMSIPPVGPVLPMPRDLPRRQPPWPSPEERRRKKNVEPLNEINMSPSALKQFAETNPAAQNITAGFELELCFSGIGTGSYGIEDEGVRNVSDVDDLREMFSEFVGRRDRGYSRMEDDYMEAWYERVDDWVHSYGRLEDRARDLAGQELSRAEIQDRAEKLQQEAGDEDQDVDAYFDQAEAQLVDETWESFQDQAREELEDEARDDIDFSFNDWLRRNFESLSSVAYEYDLSVPFNDDDSEAFSEDEMENAAQYLEEETGLQVRVSGSYHGVRRGDYIIIEPDSSIEPDSGDAGAEVVTPPRPLPETLRLFGQVVAWAKSHGGYTNQSTGLHFNISSPDMERFDYLKMALLLGDDYLLRQFGRAYNSYARSAMDKISRILYSGRADEDSEALKVMQGLRAHTHETAQQLMTEWFRNPKGIGDKYTSLHWTGDYMEVRSMGGQDILARPDQALQGVYRIVRVWSSAVDPDLDRQDYLKKLYKMTQGALEWQRAPKGQLINLSEVLARYIAGDQVAAREMVKMFRQQQQSKKPQAQAAASSAPAIKPSTPQPTGFGEFTGRWLIKADGKLIHAISGIGNVQADANRVALRWLLDNGYAGSQAEFEIVPEFR